MLEILKKFQDICSEPYTGLAEWKKKGNRRIIGCLPMHLPEEIIHAAGILPVTILGSKRPVTAAERCLPPYFCHPGRVMLDLALNGDLDFFDGFVFPDICDLMQIMPDIWNYCKSFPFHHAVVVAGKYDSPSNKKYLLEEFNYLKAHLERFTGKEISNEDLKRSIAIYNENRELLHQLYQIRRSNPSVITSRNINSIVMSSMLMPKEDHSSLLSQLLPQLKTSKPSDDKIKLVLSGNFCADLGADILDLTEQAGAVVVDDDLYVGKRYFATKVNESIDPIEALAEQYIGDLPCPTKYNLDVTYGAYLADLAKETKADGVVIIMVKYCEVHGFAYPFLKAKLSEENIPHLLIETGASATPEQLRTRIQAFVERLEDMR